MNVIKTSFCKWKRSFNKVGAKVSKDTHCLQQLVSGGHIHTSIDFHTGSQALIVYLHY